jgi:hypothetical protein
MSSPPLPNKSASLSPIFSRILIGVVLLFNLQAALAFLLNSASYASSFALPPVSGPALIQAIAILFLMWNVPYAVAFWDPIHHRLSLLEAITMQVIGLLGETLIYFSLTSVPAPLTTALLRFILFDTFGLLALLAALWLARRA